MFWLWFNIIKEATWGMIQASTIAGKGPGSDFANQWYSQGEEDAKSKVGLPKSRPKMDLDAKHWYDKGYHDDIDLLKQLGVNRGDS
jgi:hypothetical protein